MGDLIYAALVLSVPFMFGVIVGRGIRPGKSLEHRFGEIIKGRIYAVMERRQFVGNGVQIEASDTLNLEDGRSIDIIVRERG